MSQNRDELIATSVNRLAERKLETVAGDLGAIVAEDARAGRLISRAHISRIEGACAAGMSAIGNACAVHIAEIEGAKSIDHIATLSNVLTNVTEKLVSLFNEYAMPGVSSQDHHFQSVTAGRRSELEAKLVDLRSEMVDNLALGIAGGKNVTKQQKPEVSVDTGGGAAQVMVNSPNAKQSVGRDQTGGVRIDLSRLRQDLVRIRAEVSEASLEPDQRDEIDDAILNIEREAEAEPQDQRRIMRFMKALCERLERFGINAAAGIAAHYVVAGLS